MPDTTDSPDLPPVKDCVAVLARCSLLSLHTDTRWQKTHHNLDTSITEAEMFLFFIKLSSLDAREVIRMATSGVASDENFVKVTFPSL